MRKTYRGFPRRRNVAAFDDVTNARGLRADVDARALAAVAVAVAIGRHNARRRGTSGRRR
jgi:hypothetical protein